MKTGLLLLAISTVIGATALAGVTKDICAINAHEGDVCDYQIKKLQSLADEGTVIKCQKIQTAQQTKYVVEIPSYPMGRLLYDVDVNNSGDSCVIVKMTVRP